MPASRTSSRWSQRGEVATLNLVLKADVQGSLEALTDALRKLDQEHEEVRLSFVHRAVGGINESDINLAAVSNATVIGFNVRPDRKARELADAERRGDAPLRGHLPGARRRQQSALLGMLKPEFEEVVTGEAEVREVFSRAACRQGRRLLRAQRRRSPVARRCGSCARASSSGTARSRRCGGSRTTSARCSPGFECGIGLENYQDLKPGDVIETYDVREIARV